MFEGRSKHVVLSIVVVIPFALAGCMGAADCTGQQGAGGQSGVCNGTDSFSYGGQMSSETDTETYTWENTNEQARVTWGGQGSSGSVTVSIEDASGQQVYHQSFSGGQSGSSTVTDAGEPGDWTIRIRFSGFTGQMGLTVNAS